MQYKVITIIDLYKFSTFTVGSHSFYKTTTLILQSNEQGIFIRLYIDLYKLTTFTTGTQSFYSTTTFKYRSNSFSIL